MIIRRGQKETREEFPEFRTFAMPKTVTHWEVRFFLNRVLANSSLNVG